MESDTDLIQVAYASRATSAEIARAPELRAMLAAAREHNQRHGISGMLMSSHGHYVQLLEGPPHAVQALYQRIEADPRHREVSRFWSAPATERSLGAWSMCLVEPTEPEAATARRIDALRHRLPQDPGARVADFFRLLIAPNVNPALEDAGRTPGLRRVAFASPGGLWSASLIQQVARDSLVSAGRTRVDDGADPTRRNVVEYLDLPVAGLGAVRAVSIPGDPAAFAPVMPLVEDLSLLTLMLGPSDFKPFVLAFERWVQFLLARPDIRHILIVASARDERVEAAAERLRDVSGATVTTSVIKLSQMNTVWKAACDLLRDIPATAAAPVAPAKPAKATKVAKPTKAAPPSAPRAAAAATPPAHDADSPWREALARSGCLERLLEVEGSLHAAVLDTEPPGLLLRRGADDAPEPLLDAARFLAAKRRLVAQLDASESIHDIVLTTTSALHLFRPLQVRPSLFLALTIRRDGAPLGSGRLALETVEQSLRSFPSAG